MVYQYQLGNDDYSFTLLQVSLRLSEDNLLIHKELLTYDVASFFADLDAYTGLLLGFAVIAILDLSIRLLDFFMALECWSKISERMRATTAKVDEVNRKKSAQSA